MSRASSVLSTVSNRSYGQEDAFSTSRLRSYESEGYRRGLSSSYSSRSSSPMALDSKPPLPRGRRTPSPIPKYTETLIKASQRLRQRSLPPPPPPPPKFEPLSIPDYLVSNYSSGSRPIMKPRVVGSDFYRGKVRSIYEREPLFEDFCRTLPSTGYSVYNAGHMAEMKKGFKAMVDDKWKRKNYSDPSVEMNFGSKLYPWRNMVVKDDVPASERLGDEHSRRGRSSTPVMMPRIRVYHRSTWT